MSWKWKNFDGKQINNKVTKHGTGAKITVPKQWIGKKARVELINGTTQDIQKVLNLIKKDKERATKQLNKGENKDYNYGKIRALKLLQRKIKKVNK